MRRTVSLLVLALALVVGACGGGDGGEGADSDYCKQLKKTASEATAQRTTTSAKDQAAALKAQQEDFNKIVDEIVDKAPKELEDDYKAFKDFIALRFELSAKPELAQTETARIKAVQEKYTPAAKAISDYNTNVCKFQTTTTAARSAATTATTATTAATTATTTK